MTERELKKEFSEHRTSWKWFERNRLNSIHFRVDKDAALEFDLMLEILKELQFANDMRRRGK